MPESGLDAEISICKTLAKCSSLIMTHSANSSDPLSHSIRHPGKMDGPHLLRSVLKSRSMPGSNERTMKAFPRSVSISPVKERTTLSSPGYTEVSVEKNESAPCKKKCLCAPTTHAGSFRCRLHRLPPSQAGMSAAAKKTSSQLSSSKSKFSMNQQQLKQGVRSLPTSAPRGYEVKASRLCRVTMAEDQKEATSAAREAPAIVEKVSTAVCAEYVTAKWPCSAFGAVDSHKHGDGLESLKQMIPSDAVGVQAGIHYTSCNPPEFL